MIVVFPIPFNLVHAIVDAAAYEESGRAVALCGRFTLTCGMARLGHRLSSDFGGDNYSFCVTSYGGGDRLFSGDGFCY